MKRFKASLVAIMLLAFLALVAIPAMDAGAYTVKQQWIRFSATAGETLTTGDLVALRDANGYAYKAQADTTNRRPAVGIIGKGGTSGQTVEIIVIGIVSGWTSLAEGQTAYASDTSGAITQSSPTWSQPVAVAISTTEYLVNCRNYLDSSNFVVSPTAQDGSGSVWIDTSGYVVHEGATANDYETTWAVADPTADRTQTFPDRSGEVLLSPAVKDASNAVWLDASGDIISEGATADAYETTVTVADPTADRTITYPDGSGTVVLSALATNVRDASDAVTMVSNGIEYEGATANAYETTVTVTDPTADRTITYPDATGTVLLSPAVKDASNAVWLDASGNIVSEGATANDFETTVAATDPTADRTITYPDGSGTVVLSALSTNVRDASNAVTMISNGIEFEGATADDFETTVSVTDPTADRTITYPDATGTVLLSPAVKDASNAVWLDASGNVVFEGATANDYETTITITDPTADNTVTMPDATGTVVLDASVNHDYAAAHDDWVLTVREANATYIGVQGGDASANAILPSCTAGHIYIVENALGTADAVLTFKVTGQTGGTIAKTKFAIYACKGTDVVEVIEQP